MKYLALLGNLDRMAMMACTSWALYDPAHMKLAVLCSGIALAAGQGLNSISRFYGGGDVVDLTKQVLAKKKEESK